ncbi:MAG: fluoride efflux transporter CrcB [Pseudomonadota bacterium]|nr:fluoride efflux transporter CrcB [Pseudomonadota bacterium]
MAGWGFVAVGVGAAVGAWCRWGLAIALNHRAPQFPLGTLIANLAGGYLVGIAIAFFATRDELAPEARLFVITGFLGGLTTFSTFSGEVTQLLLRGQYAAAAGLALAHLAGSLLLTFLGIASFRALV